MKKLMLCLLLILVAGCGGGGGGEDPCVTTMSGLTKPAGVEPWVAGGQACEEGTPNVALLLVVDSQGNPVSSCTGAYVSLTSVLTAAHCFMSWPTGGGMWVLSRGYRRYLTKVTYSRLYSGSVYSPFDLAVVKVNEPISSAPVPVLFSRNPVDGEDLVVYGYGVDENGANFINRIENGDAPLQATFLKYAGYNQGTETVISTGEGSICSGDSGGPVLAKNKSGNWGIMGVTRAAPRGCSAEKGRPSYLSSTQSNGAVDFLRGVVPDLAVN